MITSTLSWRRHRSSGIQVLRNGTFTAVQRVTIIGGGPAGMIAAERLSDHFEVHLYEQGRTLGRKFLVAGDGGLNITTKAEGEALREWYAPAAWMDPMLDAFGPSELRAWLQGLGIPTFIGSSGRVFPERGIKPAQVLKAITMRLQNKGVHIHPEHRFVGFDRAVRPLMDHNGTSLEVRSEHTLFALGGASWSRTGSTGEWRTHFEGIGVRTVPFRASNCGVVVDLPETIRPHIGKPLKNIAITAGGRTVRGEATITEHGLEGNAIYPLIPEVRAQLDANVIAELIIDLKPDSSLGTLEQRLSGAAWKERMAALRMDRSTVALFKAFTPVQRYLEGRSLAQDVKQLHVPVKGLRPIEEAISTVGGIALDEVDDNLSLKGHPHLFVAGEMLDWDAPTGGFLLQGAFTTGRWAAEAIAQRAKNGQPKR
ncbi:MAG: NAD(P)-dependent oxidoreductase [Flavobacteriales bacterium]|nr:NAD(P)-dependent oxidoreductase [Flavobacteriales bacterium]